MSDVKIVTSQVENANQRLADLGTTSTENAASRLGDVADSQTTAKWGIESGPAKFSRDYQELLVAVQDRLTRARQALDGFSSAVSSMTSSFDETDSEITRAADGTQTEGSAAVRGDIDSL